MTKTISILGCGWLGFPLAQLLIKHDYQVKGSTTTPHKVDLLKQNGIGPYLLHFNPHHTGDGAEDFFAAQVLILTIPFRRNLTDPHFYIRQMEAVAEKVRTSSIEFVVFTGSTSVYLDSKGEVFERDVLNPHDERSKVLLDIERMLLRSRDFEATVVRFGGLYGEDRPLWKSLADPSDLKEGNKTLNVIHRDDAVQILLEIIRQDIRGEIFNACSDQHPTRKELYTRQALQRGLKPPYAALEEKSGYKIVSNTKIKERLGYQFKYPDPMQG